MTATPIPRTLTLTLYGDLDVSTLDEMPGGRGKIVTAVREPAKLPDAVKFLREQLDAGRQAYIVYPLIDEVGETRGEGGGGGVCKMARTARADAVRAAARADRRRRKRKRSWSASGAARRKALIATTVIEVGIDVPNATVMLIENAERFGLAQLHQLRGRIGRGEHKSYCILLSASGRRGGAGKAAHPRDRRPTASKSPRPTCACAARATFSAPRRAGCRRSRSAICSRDSELMRSRATPPSSSSSAIRSSNVRRTPAAGNCSPRTGAPCSRKSANHARTPPPSPAPRHRHPRRPTRWWRYDHRDGRALPETIHARRRRRSSNLDDVQVLAAIDAEYTQLVAVGRARASSASPARARCYAARAADHSGSARGPAAAQQAKSTSLGTGVIVSKEGHILTNHHVVAGMTEIRVQLTDGRNLRRAAHRQRSGDGHRRAEDRRAEHRTAAARRQR